MQYTNKSYRILILLIFILCSSSIFAQSKKKPAEKAPTQKEMQDMMKQAQGMMEEAMAEMSEEDKKAMDSMGIKMPDFNKSKKQVEGVSDNQLASAWDEENLIVPKRDAVRIAAIPKVVSDARMETYIAAIQKKMIPTFDAGLVKMGDKVFDFIQSNSKNNAEAGNMAIALWMKGKPQLALYVLGKVCLKQPTKTDNLSNYAAMLSMQGGQHLAIPILNNLNSKFPKNSTLLNNLGQAWLGLGELVRAEKYLDSAIAIYKFHPQANLAKAAISESKGKKEEAKEAIKKSIQQAYTDEKDEKLVKLGEKSPHKHYLLPPRSKTDVLNLDGFRSPYFPMTSLACITAEVEWKDFYTQIDEKINSLLRLRKDAEDAAIKGKQKRLDDNVVFIKTAQINPGSTGNMIVVPLYAKRAIKKLEASMDLSQRKLEAYNYRLQQYAQESLQLKKAYDEEMKKLQKEDSDQTGSHRANENYCPKYKAATDKFLKDINSKLQLLYMDALTLKKEMINESAYHTMYIMWPDEFQVAKLDYQIEWLNFLKKGFGAPAYGSGFPFASITLNGFSCNDDPKEEEGIKQNKLQKFDDVHCEYHSKTDLKIIKFASDCSIMTSELDLKFIQYTRKDDFDRAENDTYISSTIKISAEIGKGESAGPVKVEAKIGAGIEVEMDRKGVKDVVVVVEGKVGVGTNVFDEGLEKHGNIAGKDIMDTTIEAGVEARISIMSGQGSVTGTGVLSGIKVAEW